MFEPYKRCNSKVIAIKCILSKSLPAYHFNRAVAKNCPDYIYIYIFEEIFVNMDILRSFDYSNTTNTKTYVKILHPTARGVVAKHHLKPASRKKMVGLKHNFHS